MVLVLRSTARVGFVFALVLASACVELKQGTDPPEGVTCTEFVVAGDTGESLSDALAKAKPGTCVVVGSSTYKGNFGVPQGVTLASSKGKRAVLQGTDKARPTVSLVGGTGTGLFSLGIVDAAGVGISVDGGPVLIRDVTIERVADVGLVAKCDDCDDKRAIELRDVRIKGTKLGAWFRGGHVKWTGGSSSESRSTSISGGAGIIAQDGTRLELTGVTVENNEAVGVLLDGAKGTSAVLTDVRVAGNGERGIWAQRLASRTDGPSLLVKGQTVIEKNSKVGLGFLQSQGVRVENARIVGTREGKIVVNLQQAKQGDGLVFDRSAGEVADVTLEGNERAAALVDAPSAAMSITNPQLGAGGTYKIVVQNDAKKLASVPPAAVSTTEQALPTAPEVKVESYTQ